MKSESTGIISTAIACLLFRIALNTYSYDAVMGNNVHLFAQEHHKTVEE